MYLELFFIRDQEPLLLYFRGIKLFLVYFRAFRGIQCDRLCINSDLTQQISSPPRCSSQLPARHFKSSQVLGDGTEMEFSAIGCFNLTKTRYISRVRVFPFH